MSMSKRFEYRFSAEMALVSGAIILGAAILFLLHVSFFPTMQWMMGHQLSNHILITSVIGIVCGIMIIISGIMIYAQPLHIRKWGVVIWFFSSLSFFGIGGFFIGGILGIISGSMAVTKGITFFGSKSKHLK